MDISAPYNTNQPRSRGRGFQQNNRDATNSNGGGREVPLGMVIDRTARLHIDNIPLDVIEAEGNEALKSEFAAFGHIDRYVLFSDRTGRFTGGAMCTFRTPADAREALKALNGRANSDGTTLKVKIAAEHGVVLMRDLKRQRWEQQEAAARGEGVGENADPSALPGADIGARDRTRKGYNEDGSWSHDVFDRLQRGENVRPRGGYRGPDYYANRNNNSNGGNGGGFGGRCGGRGGFRGRGGRGGQSIEDRFEQYIQQRDGLLLDPNAAAPNAGAFMMAPPTDGGFGGPSPSVFAAAAPAAEAAVAAAPAMIVVPQHDDAATFGHVQQQQQPLAVPVAASSSDAGVNCFGTPADASAGPAI